MATKNIVIAPCGNRSHLFQDAWLKDKANKDFDLCLLFYHEAVNNPALYQDADYFFHLKGFKYHMLYQLLVNLHPEWLQQYDYFYFLDDDIEIDTESINTLFLLSKAHDSWISQASLTRDSFCSWPIFRQQHHSFCRYVGQIEVMAPLFHTAALKKCLPSFVANRSSWGVDAVWSRLLDYPENKLVVFDTIAMRHTQPVGGGELYQKIGVDPQVEWKAITDQFQARKHNYREYGRLQRVNKKSTWLLFLVYQCKDKWTVVKRLWNDYDLGSRIRSQCSKLLGKTKMPPAP